MVLTQQSPTSDVTLSDEDLDFFRYTCELFPAMESPLYDFDAGDHEPADVRCVYDDLRRRGLLAEGMRPSVDLASRLNTVAECDARISITRQAGLSRDRRDFYVASGRVVEYHADAGRHCFGPVQKEEGLVVGLSAEFATRPQVPIGRLALSAGDYLVFAVFARDARATPARSESEDAMSIDEVLAYFDEPESKFAHAPTNDGWQASVRALAGKGVLVSQGDGYALHSSYHALARELVAERQHCFSRFDFTGDSWLVRETNLYPTGSSVYRLDSGREGDVVIEELSAAALSTRLAATLMSLSALSAERSRR
jgi:hypothetical protein